MHLSNLQKVTVKRPVNTYQGFSDISSEAWTRIKTLHQYHSVLSVQPNLQNINVRKPFRKKLITMISKNVWFHTFGVPLTFYIIIINCISRICMYGSISNQYRMYIFLYFYTHFLLYVRSAFLITLERKILSLAVE